MVRLVVPSSFKVRQSRGYATLVNISIHVDGLRIADEFVQIDLVKCLLKRMLCEGQGWKHNRGDSLGLRLIFRVADAESAQNIAKRYGIPIAGKLVTTMRAANAFEDAVVHQRSEHRFQVPWLQPVTHGKQLGGNWPPSHL